MSFEKFLDKYMDTSGNYASASEIDIAEDAYNAGYAAALESVKSQEPAFKVGDRVARRDGVVLGTITRTHTVSVVWDEGVEATCDSRYLRKVSS